MPRQPGEDLWRERVRARTLERMEITLSEVWANRVRTIAEIRGCDDEAITEQALETLYFMVTRDALARERHTPRAHPEP